MKTKAIAYLLLLLVLSGCYTIDKPKKPENLLSKDQMVNVLVEMALMSSAKGINKKKLEENGIVPNDYIYKKKNIDSATFASSNAYYAFDIKEYTAIYERVQDSIKTLRDKYKAIEDKEKLEKAKRDSIKKAKFKKEIGQSKSRVKPVPKKVAPNIK